MFGFRTEQFDGLTPGDFDAFQEHKWSSNRFNLERMKARSHMDALGQSAWEKLPAKPEGLQFKTTVDHPHIFNGHQVQSCWAYLDRLDAEKDFVSKVIDRDMSLKEKVGDPNPLHHFAVVGLGIWTDRVEVFYRLHAHAMLDRRNLLSRLADPLEAKPSESMLLALAQQFEVRGSALALPGADTDPAPLLKSAVEGANDWFSISRTIARDEAIDLGAGLVDRLTEALPSLLRFWQFGAWTRENDRLKLSVELKKQRQEQARRMSGLEPGDTVTVLSGLLSGKQGQVLTVDNRGRARVQIGRVAIEMEGKLLKKSS